MYRRLPLAWQRHPKYAVAVICILLINAYVLLYTPSPPVKAFIIKDKSLGARLQRSNRIYEKALLERQRLISRYGSKDDIHMYPPNKDPWPAYTVWSFVPPAYNCPHEVERIGVLGDGGRWTCGLSRIAEKPDCVIYSFGTNYEASWEAEILERTNCKIWAYDSMPKSKGPRVKLANQARIDFKRYALSATNSGPNAYTLETLMKQNGHTHIDILKVDLEGGEFDVMSSIMRTYLARGEPLPFAQLHLEVHVWGKTFAAFLGWWELLETAGLRPFTVEPNLVYQNYNKGENSDLAEFSFLNIKGVNDFISDDPVSGFEQDPPEPTIPVGIRHAKNPTPAV